MTVQISLNEELSELVEANVASGHYASADDVVGNALRLLKETDHAKLKWLQQAWRVGIESGDAGEIDFEQIKAEGRALLKQRAAE